MLCSILMPSRKRYELFESVLNHAFDNAADPEQVEIIVVYDVDDQKTRLVAESCKYKNIKLLEQTEPRPFSIVGCYNRAASVATGKLLWILGNDTEVITSNWDKVLEQEVELFLDDKPDRVLYVKIDHDFPDGHGQNDMSCCFPIQTKESYEALGMVEPSEIYCWTSDHALWVIYTRLIADRILNLRDKIKICNWTWSNGKMPRDDVSWEICHKGDTGLTEEQYAKYVGLLNGRILRYQNG